MEPELRVDTTRVDPKFLQALQEGRFCSLLKEWREANPGQVPNLWRADLHDADLTGADLSGLNLAEANLRWAILNEANFNESDLSDASLNEAKLARADLRYTVLEGTSFAGADLTGANLSETSADNSSFAKANLNEANLSKISLGGASLSEAILVRANLSGANLNGADLYQADLRGADLTGASLNGAMLKEANLTGARMTGALLYRADLTRASFNDADLRGSSLTQANLFDAKFNGANLSGSDLINAVAVGTDFTGADLTGCHVYGISAWDLNLEGAVQSDLIITRDEPHIRVDDLEVAQFIYILLNRRKLRSVLTTLGEKAVLVLGRFTERKALLNGIADRLRSLGYIPIIFDFERPTNLDLTETIKVLAGLSLFVIADITNPRSVPLELQATVPDYMVPFVTVIQRGQDAFGMFDDLPKKYDWALPLLEYGTPESLLAAFEKKVVGPALEKVKDLRNRKTQPRLRRSAED